MEEELVKKSLKGDKEAFDALVLLFQARLFHYIFSIVKEEAAAKDLVQQSFVNAYHHLHTFEGRSQFSTWLYSIAHNLSLNYLKKSRRHQEISLIETKEATPLWAPEIHEKDEQLDAFIQEGMAHLSEKHRQIFELYDLKKMKHKQIAALLHLPIGTVRSRLHYARRKMKAFLQKRIKRH